MSKIKLITLMVFLMPLISIHGQIPDTSLVESLIGMPVPSTTEGDASDEEQKLMDENRETTKNLQNFEDPNYSYTGSKDFLNAPTSKYIEKPLSYFGYDFFSDVPSTFASSENTLIPPDYIIGPKDGIRVILYGNKNITHKLKVSRDGEIFFPEIGPVVVAGLSFSGLEEIIQELVSNKFIGTKTRVTLDNLRSINIFVLGEALQPGMYTVSSLSTLTNAILKNGGVKLTGSLRNIELRRKGQIISNFDAYDLLLKGDISKDVRLMEGDVVFIPLIGKTLGIDGEVNRPGIYELKDNEILSDLIKFAGNLKPKANKLSAEIRRINPLTNGFDLISVNLNLKAYDDFRVNNGDVITVYPVANNLRNAVLLSGHAQQPGFYPWNEGMRVADIIQSSNNLLSNTDLNYVLIKRKDKLKRGFQFFQINLAELLNNQGTDNNLILADQDEIIFFPSLLTQELITTRIIQDEYVLSEETNQLMLRDERTSLAYLKKSLIEEPIFSEETFYPSAEIDRGERRNLVDDGIGRYYEYRIYDYCVLPEDIANRTIDPREAPTLSQTITDVCRKQLLDPIIDLIERDNMDSQKLSTVSIFGNVHFPGTYPLTENMILADAIKAAGGTKNSTYDAEIELSRISNAGKNFSVVNDYQPMKDLLDLSLENMDVINIKQMGSEFRTVEIRGEVFFPGVYPIPQNHTLSELIRRAGGLKDSGSIKAALFQRESLKKAEAERLEEAQSELRRKILLSSNPGGFGQDQDTGSMDRVTSLLSASTSEVKTLGRLVINLEEILNEQIDDIMLEDLDTIVIPKKKQSVTVIGEVFVANSHIYTTNLGINDYINLSGGTTAFAEENNIYLIRSNGSIVSSTELSSGFFRTKSMLQPGDTIVVPLQVDTFSALRATTEITQIIYQMALAAAAVNSF